MAKKQGHYCKVCGEYKANESFSGKGHAAHICKKCAALPIEQRSESETVTRIMNLPYRLSESQKNWLKKKRNDKRPEVASAAQEAYEIRFPYAERNERKRRLHIRHMELSINAEVFDEYGDESRRELTFILDEQAHMVSLRENDVENSVTMPEKEMRKLLNSIVNYYEVFCWQEDYESVIHADTDDVYAAMRLDLDDEPALKRRIFDEISDDELSDDGNAGEEDGCNAEVDEKVVLGDPTWMVSVRYQNGEIQEMRGYEFLPDLINELVLELLSLFESDDDYDYEEYGENKE